MGLVPDRNSETPEQCQESESTNPFNHSPEIQEVQETPERNSESPVCSGSLDHTIENQQQDHESHHPVSHQLSISTFKLVGDNIDKNVKPRDMRAEHQTQSLHYFHSFAVKDRIDFSSLPNTISLISPAEVEFNVFLPSATDQLEFDNNLCVLISRVVTQYMLFFRECSGKVKQHIEHPYSKEMAQQSTVVSAGSSI